jgi:hypothetical protein
MARIQQVHWELAMDYLGHSYYVSRDAICALGRELTRAAHESLHASHGVFVPGQFGRFPEVHSQTGVRLYFGIKAEPMPTNPRNQSAGRQANSSTMALNSPE